MRSSGLCWRSQERRFRLKQAARATGAASAPFNFHATLLVTPVTLARSVQAGDQPKRDRGVVLAAGNLFKNLASGVMKFSILPVLFGLMAIWFMSPWYVGLSIGLLVWTAIEAAGQILSIPWLRIHLVFADFLRVV